MNSPAKSPDSNRRNARLALSLFVVAAGMVGLAFAAVPLYQLLCQVSGLNGTTQRAANPSAVAVDEVVTVRFDANIDNTLAWTFRPLQRRVEVKLGENALVFFEAINNSSRTLTGTATFNVVPEIAGRYFNKVQCFCFTEQTLKPGERVEMGVSFFVDPEPLKEPGAERVNEITLSYAFFESAATAVTGELAKPTPANAGG